MANGFVANYRGAKSREDARRAVSNMPVTRGDMQKNRRNSQQEPLRQLSDFGRVPGTFYETPLEERIDTDANRKFTDAIRGTLYTIQQENPAPSQMLYDDRMTELANSDVYENYDALNKVLDDFDAADTIEGKRKVVRDAWDAMQPNNWRNGPGWFLWLNGLIDYAEENGDDMSKVSKTFRYINNYAKNNLYRRV